MATEYGYRDNSGWDNWCGEYGMLDKDEATEYAKTYKYTLIAREVSEPRIVSIRA